MNKQEQLRIVFISYLISAVSAIALDYLKVSSLNNNGLLSAIKVSSVLTVWWTFYFKIGCEIPLLSKLLYRINLNGTLYI